MSSTMRTVLIRVRYEEFWLEGLQRLAPGLRIIGSGEAIADEIWREVEVLYTSFATPLPLPEEVPRLRWVQLYSAGADTVMNHPLFESSVVFTTTSGIHAVPMAEYVFMMLLGWFHRLP